MRCAHCENAVNEIAELQEKIEKFTALIDDCDCIGEEEKKKGRTCGECLYHASQIEFCWGRDLLRYSDEPRCKKFIDYEIWFKKHGIKAGETPC
jgi:hypothetical protein